MKDIAVLISGSGSSLQTTIDVYDRKQTNGTLRAVSSNKADAFGPERACAAGIPAHALVQNQFADRKVSGRQLIHKTDAYAPDLAVLAGYMCILSPTFVSHYQERLLDIHPSLLSKYPGLHIHRQVLENDDEEHEISMRFVTDELDGGPIILQAEVSVLAGDSENEVTVRVQAQEHATYPLVISWFAGRRLYMVGNHVRLGERQLPPQGYAAEE